MGIYNRGEYIKEEAPLIINRSILHHRNKPPFLLQKSRRKKLATAF